MTAICEPEEALGDLVNTVILKEPTAMPATPANSPVRIVLTGFMGAGKTTVGRLLAERLGWHFVDADRAIAEKAGMPVAEIFAKYGEFVFRRMETAAIAHALGERNAIIALGGGAVEVLANRLLLEQTPRTTVVLLEASLPVLIERCNAEGGVQLRPNLSAAQERFQYRAPLYRRVARLRVETADFTPEQVAERVEFLAGLPVGQEPSA